jgi:hypothetical protein
MNTLSDLNLLMDSGVPIICINTPVQERINLLIKIYIESTARKQIPVYLWTLAWGCFKLVKFGLYQPTYSISNPIYEF